ncbi:MAG: DUF488 domain-containing protein [Gemmatimonadetes bacterium]|nr:DUF488 domain-containing protein [Gemmatimonadota bacterium]
MPTIFTLGHSTRALDEVLELLRAPAIRLLVDVRRFPASRRHPHFARAALEQALEGAGIAYAHEPELGGRRSPRRDSPNTAWRTAGFRGYADHMASEGFRAALGRVVAAAARRTVAIMCAETVPWRCHRQLIADALVAGGIDVVHILGPGQTRPHALHAHARVLPDGGITYPGAASDQLEAPLGNHPGTGDAPET